MKQDKSTSTNSTEDFNDVIAMRDIYKACAAHYKKKLAEARDELAKGKHNYTAEIEHLREQVDDLLTDNIMLRKQIIILNNAMANPQETNDTKNLSLYTQPLGRIGIAKITKELWNNKDSHD